MTDIKPIETVYSGYRFRSRLEARWALFFDEMGIEYEYEAEGYDLGNAGWYLPDFWLPQFHMWFEVKPEWPTTGEEEKGRALHCNGIHPVVIGVGQPVFGDLLLMCHDATDSSGGFNLWPGCEWRYDEYGLLCVGVPDERDRAFMNAHWELVEWIVPMHLSAFTLEPEDAALKARQARFERP